ncbi:MAG: hypothetical protein RBQ97_09295 [Acholeplasma sp.]|nr:hypothetical protein [Acholeplasma sp.]
MKLNDLVDKINTFKSIHNTNQSWRNSDSPIFENEYIKLMRIDSSNNHSGKMASNGKQWSILIEEKKNFQMLKNWLNLKREFKDALKVTPFRKSNCGWVGIRFYEMEENPTNEIVMDILGYIFEKV